MSVLGTLLSGVFLLCWMYAMLWLTRECVVYFLLDQNGLRTTASIQDVKRIQNFPPQRHLYTWQYNVNGNSYNHYRIVAGVERRFLNIDDELDICYLHEFPNLSRQSKSWPNLSFGIIGYGLGAFFIAALLSIWTFFGLGYIFWAGLIIVFVRFPSLIAGERAIRFFEHSYLR